MQRLYKSLSLIVVVAIISIACFRCFSTGLHVNTDIFSLLPDLPRVENQTKIRFLVEGRDTINARLALRESLSEIVDFSDSGFQELRKLCQDIFPYRAAMTAAAKVDLFECRPVSDCLTQHFQSQITSNDFSGELFNCDPLLLAPNAMKTIFALGSSSEIIFAVAKPDVDLGQIDGKLSELKKKFPRTDFIWSGFSRFAASSRQRFEKEFTLMASLSTLGILIVVRWAFNSFLLIGVSLLSSLAGYILGFATCIAFKGEVHSITLTLGGSLLGACVDYSIHWFSERYWRQNQSAKEVWLDIRPTLGLGMLTSIIAIAPFYLTESVLLQEFFLFCLGALMGSLLVLPMIPLPKKLTIRKSPYLFSKKVCGQLSNLFESRSTWILVLILTISGLSFIKIEDDLRQLQAPLPELVRDEIRISKNGVPNANLMIRAKDEDEKFRTFLQILTIFSKSADGPHLPFSFTLPSQEEQEDAIKKYQDYSVEFVSEIRTVSADLGISPQLELLNPDLKKIDLKLLKALAPDLFSSSKNLTIPVVNWKDGMELPKNVHVIDYRSEISTLFARDRDQSIVGLVAGYILIGFLLVYRYRSLRALKLLTPCVLAASVTVASISLLGFPLNFFTTMALALILGLSVDYAVFFCESKDLEAVSLSVLASAATTAFAFAPLILSDTSLLQSIGVTMLIGIVSAMIFSPTAKFKIN